MPLPNIATVRQYNELFQILYFRYNQDTPQNYKKDGGVKAVEDDMISKRSQIETDYTNFITNFSADNTTHTVSMSYGYWCPYPNYSVNPQIVSDDNTVKGYSSGTIYCLMKTNQLASDLNSLTIYDNTFLQKLKDMFNNAKEYIPRNSSLNNVDLTGLSTQETKTHVENMLHLFNSIISNSYFTSKNESIAPYENNENEPKIIIKHLFNSIISSFTNAIQILYEAIIVTQYTNVNTNTAYINKQTRELCQMSGSKVDTYKSQYSQTMALGAILTIIMSALIYFVFSNIYSEGLGSSGNGSSNMPLSNGLPRT
jgi:hypothetical protein